MQFFSCCIPPLDEESTLSATKDKDTCNQDLPPLITNLQQDNLQDDNFCDIQDNFKLQYTPANIKHLEIVTTNQAISPLWFQHRRGRITGTKAHDVQVKSDSTDPIN